MGRSALLGWTSSYLNILYPHLAMASWQECWILSTSLKRMCDCQIFAEISESVDINWPFVSNFFRKCASISSVDGKPLKIKKIWTDNYFKRQMSKTGFGGPKRNCHLIKAWSIADHAIGDLIGVHFLRSRCDRRSSLEKKITRWLRPRNLRIVISQLGDWN